MDYHPWIECKDILPPEGIVVDVMLNNGRTLPAKWLGLAYGFATLNGDYIGTDNPRDFTSINCPRAWKLSSGKPGVSITIE